MKENHLVVIPPADWAKLRDLYVHRKTESGGYNLIQNYINWLKLDPSIDFTKCYSLNGDWSDGTFVFQEHGYYTYLNTLNESPDRLLDALNCLDKNAKYLFCGFPERLKPVTETYISQPDLIKVNRASYSSTNWYHISKEDALRFDTEPPEGTTISQLCLDDVDTVNGVWPHRHPGSEEFVSRLIKYNPSVGLYSKDGELVAWCLLNTMRCLGLLQVKDTHKRKGYGSLMARALSKKLAELDIEVTAPIVKTNAASTSMFEKLGFKKIDSVHWLLK